MDILVFVKQVPDDSVEIHLDGAGVPAVKDVEKVTNAFDTYALELAARYTEANGGEVTVAAIGTEDCTSMMKNLLAVGAKKAYLFKDDVFAGADEGAVAAYLAKAVKKCEAENGQPYGMILCGKESTDEISGQVGARLAEILGTGFVSSVIEAEPQDDELLWQSRKQRKATSATAWHSRQSSPLQNRPTIRVIRTLRQSWQRERPLCRYFPLRTQIFPEKKPR